MCCVGQPNITRNCDGKKMCRATRRPIILTLIFTFVVVGFPFNSAQASALRTSQESWADDVIRLEILKTREARERERNIFPRRRLTMPLSHVATAVCRRKEGLLSVITLFSQWIYFSRFFLRARHTRT